MDPLSSTPHCSFCSSTHSKYTCPRCNASYCSLKCFRCQEHLECAESFYKDQVHDELRLRAKEDRESNAGKKAVIDVLRREHEAEAEEDLVGEEEEELDSDDDADLADRLANIDLDDTDAVWAALTEDERRSFLAAVKDGSADALVPDVVPFWIKDEHKADLITELDQESKKHRVIPLSKLTKAAPSPAVKYGLLNVLFAYAFAVRHLAIDDENSDKENAASTSHFVRMCMHVSGNMSRSENFGTATEATDAAAAIVSEVMAEADESPEETEKALAGIRRDVLRIVKGPAKGSNSGAFITRALTDLNSKVTTYIKAVKHEKKSEKNAAKNEERFTELDANSSQADVGLKAESKSGKSVRFEAPQGSLPPWRSSASLSLSDAKKASKKIDFYLSWMLEHNSEYDALREMATGAEAKITLDI